MTSMFETRRESNVCRAGLVSLLTLVGMLACSSGPERPAMARVRSVATGGQGSNHATATCSEGETRECSVTLAQHGDVLSCLYGTETCSGSQWSSCEQGSVSLMAAPAHGDRRLSSISPDAGPCKDNPCDPTCQAYREKPGTPLVAQLNTTAGWWTGAIALLPPSVQGIISKPDCETAEDCQQNQHCVNVATASTCAHNKCEPGVGLDSTCTDSCVQAICDEKPACCQTNVPAPCGNNEITDATGRCFYYEATDMTWTDAQASCAARGTDWNLACISSQDQQALIAANNNTNSWLGLTRTQDNVTGSPFICTNGETPLADGLQTGIAPWRIGQPNNSGGYQNCVDIYASPSGQWNDTWCNSWWPSWCEGPAPVADYWNADCVSEIASTCGATCDTSGNSQAGTCIAWSPGQTNPNDGNFDVSIDVPCDGLIPVCNHGRQPAPVGMIVHVFAADSGQNDSDAGPELSDAGTELGQCVTNEPIATGACIMVSGCSDLLLLADAKLRVEAPSGDESRTDDNWGYSVAGTGCVIPHCAASSGGTPCLTSQTVNEDYQGSCPNTSELPQWSFLQFQSNTPGDSTIDIQIAAAPTIEGLATATPIPLVTVSQAAGNDNCVPSSAPVPNCPVDLYQALSPSGGADSAYVRLIITLNPSSDGMQTPEFDNWRVNFACPDAT